MAPHVKKKREGEEDEQGEPERNKRKLEYPDLGNDVLQGESFQWCFAEIKKAMIRWRMHGLNLPCEAFIGSF